MLLCSEACVFDLADPVKKTLDSGAGGSPDVARFDSGTGGRIECQPGEKPCGTPPQCVSVDNPLFGCSPESCGPCDTMENAVPRCESGACVLGGCAAGFGDCDGDAQNGCETQFGVTWPDPPGEPEVDPIVAERFPSGTNLRVDARDLEWSGHARHPVVATCLLCTDQPDIAPVASRLLPPKEDLTAWYRFGWDDSFLYVFVEVRDDDLVEVVRLPDAGSTTLAQDSVELLINGNNSRELFYDADDRQLFFALDGSVEWPYRQAMFSDPNVSAISRGLGCYTFEAQMTWSYVSAGSFTSRTEGDQVGFVLAINDWDSDTGSTDSAVERSSHVFSKNPEDQYWNYTTAFGSLSLGP